MVKSEELKKVNRQTLLESEDFGHIREALTVHAEMRAQRGEQFDIMRPIRETPLSAFFAKQDLSMENMKMNPHLDSIWYTRYGIRIGDMAQTNRQIGSYTLQEAVAIPTNLSILKIADEIIEGAEPWSDWKSYTRMVSMDTPKVNVPKTKYTAQVGGGSTDKISIFKEAGGKPPVIGGQIETISLDCSGTTNSYRGTIQVNRNDVKDNNFLAVEQPLKNAGNMFYYLVGSQVISVLTSNTTTNTNGRTSLDNPSGGGASQSFMEALSNVIRNQFPTQRNKADTMFINPTDAWKLIATAGSTGGYYPMINRFMLGPMPQGPEKDVINDSAVATALGLRNVWETPQIAAGTVMVTKRDVASVTGLREDLTLENYDLTVGGIYNSDLVIRFDSEFGYESGCFKVTSF